MHFNNTFWLVRLFESVQVEVVFDTLHMLIRTLIVFFFGLHMPPAFWRCTLSFSFAFCFVQGHDRVLAS